MTLSIADAFDLLLKEPLPLRFSAYDGSATGPEDAPFHMRLLNERGLAYMLTSIDPDLAFGRAYVAGDLVVEGVHPGDPYEALVVLQKGLKFRRPTPAELVTLLRSMGLSQLRPPAPPLAPVRRVHEAPRPRPPLRHRRQAGPSGGSPAA
jgi:cyclopropane-fatty-acyl-phospholipid synthase